MHFAGGTGGASPYMIHDPELSKFPARFVVRWVRV